MHHCYCHSPTKGCSQQDTTNEGSTYTHTGAVTYVRIGREVVSSKVIISHVNRQILYTTHHTSSLLRDIMSHYYIIVVGCSGPWTEERNLTFQKQFYVMISSCEGWKFTIGRYIRLLALLWQCINSGYIYNNIYQTHAGYKLYKFMIMCHCM